MGQDLNYLMLLRQKEYLVLFVVVFGTYLNYSANNDIPDCYSTTIWGRCNAGDLRCINVTLRWHKLDYEWWFYFMCVGTSLVHTSLDSINFLLYIFQERTRWENHGYFYYCSCDSVILMDDNCHNFFVRCAWPVMHNWSIAWRTVLLKLCHVPTLRCLWFNYINADL